MDGQRFDRLTRMIASRRGVVRGLAAVVIGGAALGVADADARISTCRRGRQTCQRHNQCCSEECLRGVGVPLKDRNRCACEDGLTQCGSRCVDLATDDRNCSACGATCAAGSTCCGGVCVDLRHDANHCGACSDPCAASSSCCNGVCRNLGADEGNCGTCGHNCGPNDVCVSGACFCLASCESNCGHDDGCGNLCPSYLAEGVCVDAQSYCDVGEWGGESGSAAQCLVTTEGKAVVQCRHRGQDHDWDYGSTCDTSSDCEAWCAEKDNVYACYCVEAAYYTHDAVDEYSSTGNRCSVWFGTEWEGGYCGVED
jgi:hypothetical protein